MTGFNHHANCTCGWCVNLGGRSHTRQDLAQQLPRLRAVSLLAEHNVRTVTACYVNPNAKCPVCGQAVYFYANQSGSRVYFDSLGWPWPKHPCTDTPRTRSMFRHLQVAAPARRARGLSQELIEAAHTAGLADAPTTSSKDWRLLVVQSSDRDDGDRVVVVAEYLDRPGRYETIAYHFPRDLVQIGDFISYRFGIASILDRETMAEVRFRSGEHIKPPPSPISNAKPPSAPAPIRAQKVPPTSSPRLTWPEARSFDMTRAEMVHFHSEQMHVADFCDNLDPIVRSYARAGVRKPLEVSQRLNRDGHRTVNNSRWTPRLTFFLLGLLFNEPKGPADERPSGNVWGQATGPLSSDEIASRLSRLGRVIRKEN